jgi:hypothetical protein
MVIDSFFLKHIQQATESYILFLYLTMFLKRYCVVGLFVFYAIARVKKPLKSVFGRKGLTESSVSAREEKLRRRLTTVEQAIQASQQTEPDDEDPTAMNI